MAAPTFAGLGPPTPETTLVVLLGASKYPHKPDWTNPVLEASAEAIRDYIESPDGLALTRAQIFDRFDSEDHQAAQLLDIESFLRTAPVHARDLIVYYIGHGEFESREYYLGIRNTQRYRQDITAIESRKLAKIVREGFRNKRIYVIIDACFAASAVRDWQGDEAIAAIRNLEQHLPSRGTLILAAASKYDIAVAPRAERYTIFTGALLDALRLGVEGAGARLSFYELYGEIRSLLRDRVAGDDGRPELHVPGQKDGDISRIAMFPNAAHVRTVEAECAKVTEHEATERKVLEITATRATVARKHGDYGDTDIADVAVLIALEWEFEQLAALVELKDGIQDDRDGWYFPFSLPGNGREHGATREYRCVAKVIGEMDRLQVAGSANRMLDRWKPAVAVMIGRATSLDDEVKLGDIIVARQIDDYAANLKAAPVGDGFEFHHGGQVFRGDVSLVAKTTGLRQARPKEFNAFIDGCIKERAAQLLPNALRELQAGTLLSSEPTIHSIHLASGLVLEAAPAFKTWLKRRDRELKALDMESAGFAAAAEGRGPHSRALVLRGISDFADERKKEFDTTYQDGIRRYAMRNVVRYLRLLMQLNLLPRHP